MISCLITVVVSVIAMTESAFYFTETTKWSLVESFLIGSSWQLVR
jgi:hypothetical protein